VAKVVELGERARAVLSVGTDSPHDHDDSSLRDFSSAGIRFSAGRRFS